MCEVTQRAKRENEAQEVTAAADKSSKSKEVPPQGQTLQHTQGKAWKDPQGLCLDVHSGPGRAGCVRSRLMERGTGSGLPSQLSRVTLGVQEL